MFITNNHSSVHLCRKENSIKHQKVSKYYDHDCSTKLSGNTIIAGNLKNYTKKLSQINSDKNVLDATNFHSKFDTVPIQNTLPPEVSQMK